LVLVIAIIVNYWGLTQYKIWRVRADATIIWDGGGDGVSWSDPLNWSTDTAPISTDRVLIDTATTVRLSSPTTIEALVVGNVTGTIASILEFNYDSIATNSPLTISGGDLTIYPGANITHSQASGNTVVGTININITTGNAFIYGNINLANKGFTSSHGPGVPTSEPAGAAHAGNGGNGSTTVYGSITQPTTLGSGGLGNNAGIGGGAAKLVAAGDITVNGNITANASSGACGGSNNWWSRGGGSGGSIWISATNLSGSGNISANGGSSVSCYRDTGSGGAAGRIAIYYTGTNSISSGQLTAMGGRGGATWRQKGGAGTILVKSSSQTYGDLTIDNNETSWTSNPSYYALTRIPANLTMDSISIKKYARVSNEAIISTTDLNVKESGYFYSNLSTTTNYTNIDWAGGNIVDNGGTFTLVSEGGNLTVPTDALLEVNVPRSFVNVTLDGTLSHSANVSTETNKLNITASGNFTINSAGSINTKGKGYAPGHGPGAGTSGTGGAGGAAHAGYGGNGQGRAGSTTTYGSVKEPLLLGSGGGHDGNNMTENGGGAIRLVISGELLVNGNISANGNDSPFTTASWTNANGGGSGGSIWITANSISGTGNITASGGSAADITCHSCFDAGGGGGGRIALYYTSSNSLGSSQISAVGGKADGSNQRGGAGTIFVKSASQTNGDLRIDNVDTTWSSNRNKYALTPFDNSISLDTLTIRNFAFVTNNTTITTTDLNIRDSAYFFNNISTTINYTNIDWAGGNIIDNGGTFTLVSGGGNLTVPTGSLLEANVPRSFVNVTLDGTLSHSANVSTETNKLNITASGNFTINSAGSINTKGKGYAPGHGPGAGTSGTGGAGGAAHAGYGGNGQGRAGSTTTYGSVKEPLLLGSGGGHDGNNMTENGGGAIRLVISGELLVNGNISANGNDSPFTTVNYTNANGGGSGGSIWITANSISGTGNITASGGSAADITCFSCFDAGGGGGGRIALYYTSSNSLGSSQISAVGGKADGSNQRGGAGTIFVKSASQTNGDLRIDNVDTTWSSNRNKYALTPFDNSISLDTLTIRNFAFVTNNTTITTTDLNIRDSAYFFNNISTTINYTNIDWAGGNIIDNGGTFTLVSGLGDLYVPTGAAIEINVQRTFENVILDGMLTHASNSSSETYKLNLVVNQNFTVNSSGSVNVNSKGYGGGHGPGVGTGGAGGSGGAAHAGVGGNGQGQPGSTFIYGSETEPFSLGSGGGHSGNNLAGSGGGAVKLAIGGDLQVSGVISANGQTSIFTSTNSSSGGGGGSGGSIWISADLISGTGNITANGGGAPNLTCWSCTDGGGGGGGRIALHFTNAQNIQPQNISANGGVAQGTAQNGGAGDIQQFGYPYDPINLNQFQSDGTTAIAIGGTTGENTFVAKFQINDANDTDTLTPEVEIQPIGVPFNDVATHTGGEVAYSGTPITTAITIDGLADMSEYHWQARTCDSTGLCSAWVSAGNNPEGERDIRVLMNNPPNIPVIPESSFYINGKFTNSVQPIFNFVLTDPNTTDAVGYRIQVANNSEFSELVLDYTSPMGPQGANHFTVGQTQGDGEYLSGSEAQELGTGPYYWRVKNIDEKNGESDWAVAPGTPAFSIDLSIPTSATNTRMKAHSGAMHEYSQSEDDLWFNRGDLYFEWDPGTDDEQVKGYCLYLGQDSEANAGSEKGILGDSPLSTTGSTCDFITENTYIDFSNSALRGTTWLTSSSQKYYFKVITIDVANNVFDGPETTNYISFKFDNTPPENVTAISAPSSTFSSVSEMHFSWPTSQGNGGSDLHSGVLGFQFALNSKDTWYGDTLDTTTGLEYYSLLTEQPFFLPSEIHQLINLGQNTLFFRVLDQAGNNSELRTVYLNYGGEAPKFAEGSDVTVTPSTSSINSFGFSWPEPIISEGNEFETYYYMINTTPPASLATITSNSARYIPVLNNSIPQASIPGLIKGSNSIYVVAVDKNDNYSPSNSISATFVLDSNLPDPPSNLIISDSSIKDVSIWRAALIWDEPEYKGTGSLVYHIERSEDGILWDYVGVTMGRAYVDIVNESKRYYWRVGTSDNSDESLRNPSYSNALSIIPRGQYTEPPKLTSGPASSSITTTRATISWTTSRGADSKVAFGLGSGNYFEWEPSMSNHTTDHMIPLTNLKPGTEYYYVARWTDEDGNTGVSEESNFTTEPPPEVKDVRISNLGINSATVNFTTKNASGVRIYYGPTTAFGGVREIATSKLETSYSVQLDNLEDGTKYSYRINTFDEEGEEYPGTILDFETMPRPKVSNILVQQVARTAQSTLLVTWESNTAITSIVTFHPENNPELMQDIVDLDLTKGNHRMVIRGLLPSTNYILRVRGKDVIGNEAVSENLMVTTSTDTRPPQISNLNIESTNISILERTSSTTSSQLIVTWTTDEPATSQVEFGEGTSDTYTQLTQEDKNLSYNHVVIISGLTPSKVYHLRAISRDSSANESRSVDTVTITPRATDSAFNLVITTLQDAFRFLNNL
jgi:hypothetical protein